jgi:PAS domain S-box-containing protein
MACRYLGYTREELLGLTVADLQAPENAVPAVDNLTRLLRVGTSHFDRIHIAKDGRHIPVEVTAHVVELSGAHYGLSIVRDVSERRALESKLRQAERLEAIGRLAGGVAHDFNNVLTAVLGYAQIVESDARAGRPANPEHVAEIRVAAERAAQMTRQLLGFSRPQLGEPRDIDVGVVLREMQRFFERITGAHSTLAVDAPVEPHVVRIDPGQLQQILLNLVVNARDAMPDGGVITLSASSAEIKGDADLADGPYVVLSVSDTGMGMTPEVQARIFEPFFTTKAPEKGTGIGLATVQRVVAAAKGAIRVESSPGHGSTFRVHLPRQSSEVAVALPALPRARTPSGKSHVGTVLLVEDDDAIRALAKSALAGTGLRVIEARHVAEALALLGEPRPALALVVTDVVLPGASGKELVRVLRTTQPELPAVVMSGFTTEDLHDLSAGGARHRFLSKPFPPATLLAAVDELCPDPATLLRGARVLIVDDDEMSRTVQRHLLERLGVECGEAATGAEAIAVLSRDGAGLAAVLLDFSLPDMNAPAVVAKIRALGRADLPVIAVTGHTSDENLAECLAAGMVGRVTKPIDDRELTLALARWKRPPG